MEDDKKLEGPQNPDQKVENTQQDQEEAADKTVSNTVQVPAAQANTITNPTIANIKTEQIDQKQKPIIKTIEKGQSTSLLPDIESALKNGPITKEMIKAQIIKDGEIKLNEDEKTAISNILDKIPDITKENYKDNAIKSSIENIIKEAINVVKKGHPEISGDFDYNEFLYTASTGNKIINMSIKQQEIVLEAETIKKEKTIEMGKEVDDFFESGGEITDNDFDLILTKLKESQMMTTPTLSEEYFNSQNQDKNYTYQQFSKDRQIINGNAIIDLIQTANLYINKDNYKKPGKFFENIDSDIKDIPLTDEQKKAMERIDQITPTNTTQTGGVEKALKYFEDNWKGFITGLVQYKKNPEQFLQDEGTISIDKAQEQSEKVQIEQKLQESLEKDFTENIKNNPNDLATAAIKTLQENPDKIKEIGSIDAIMDLAGEGKMREAMDMFIKLVANLFSGKTQGGFEHLSGMLEQLDLTNKSDEELQKIITDFTSQIDSIDSINDVSDATYLMSRAKDALVKKQHPDQKERNSIQLMKHAIIGNGNNVLGKVINFNDGGRGDKGILGGFGKGIQGFGEQRQHTAIITGYDQQSGDIQITHATRKGVITTNIDQYINDYYIKKAGGVDVLVMDPPNTVSNAIIQNVENKGNEVDKGNEEQNTASTQKGDINQSINFIKNQEGKSYDIKGMGKDILSGGRGKQENSDESFYCSELIVRGLEEGGYPISKDIFRPSQLLKILKPSYCTTIEDGNKNI